MSTLVILNGKFRGQGCDLESFRGLDRITIGRTEDNTFQIPDDSISGAHCELLLSANGVAVRDLKSQNGTFIDGKAVPAGALLPGQVLRLGHVEIRLEADKAPATLEYGLREEIAGLVQPLDRYRLSPAWRERAAVIATGAWAGYFTWFATGALPYYPNGWRLLLAAAVIAAWLVRPRLGTVLGMGGLLLPVAYNLSAAFVLGGIILAALLTANSFLVLSVMCFLLPRAEWALVLVPLAAGFLKMGRGAFTAGLACLIIELFMAASGRDLVTGATGTPLIDVHTLPIASLSNWDWVGKPSSGSGEAWIKAASVFLDHPQLLGQVFVWAASALLVAWLLSQPSNRYAPIRVVAVGGGALGLLFGSALLSAFVGPSVMAHVAGYGSIGLGASLMMLVGPAWTATVSALSTASTKTASNSSMHSQETPKDEWSELAGVDDIQNEVRRAVRSHFDRGERESLKRLSLKPPKGVLFFGPPGTGKTKLARLLASEAKAAFYAVSGTEFTSKWYGESEANLRRIFDTAREHRPAVLFFDELEAFLPKRTDLSRSDAPEKGILATFLAYTDGIADLDGVFLVGATNHPELIDPAALRPGRFDKVIYVSPPDAAARRSILERYLNDKPLAENVDFDKLAAITERFTGADIQAACKEAILEGVVRGQQSVISMNTLVNVIRGAKPSVTFEMLRNYEKIADQYGRRSQKQVKTNVVAKAQVEWEDVAGLDEVKQALQEAVEMPLNHSEVFQEYGVKPPKGVLLYGPPGCGKTLLAKVIAKVAKANFVHVKGPELLRQFTGQSEAKLRDVFDRGRESTPCVLFFDEIDALAGERGTGNATGTQILTQFLTEMDGMEELKGVVVVAATNRPDCLDQALLRPGRFDRLLYVPPPDHAARVGLFHHELQRKPVDPDLDYPRLATLTEGYSCADVAAVCNQTALAAARDRLASGERQPITMQRLEAQIQRTPSSIHPDELARHEKLRAQFRR